MSSVILFFYTFSKKRRTSKKKKINKIAKEVKVVPSSASPLLESYQVLGITLRVVKYDEDPWVGHLIHHAVIVSVGSFGVLYGGTMMSLLPTV